MRLPPQTQFFRKCMHLSRQYSSYHIVNQLRTKKPVPYDSVFFQWIACGWNSISVSVQKLLQIHVGLAKEQGLFLDQPNLEGTTAQDLLKSQLNAAVTLKEVSLSLAKPN